MKLPISCVLLSILLCAPFFLEAAPDESTISPHPLTLAELLDLALKNNPETEKVWANVRRAQGTLGVAKSPAYPHLNAQGKLTHGREVKYVNGPDTTFTSYSGELNLNYLLCDFGETRAAVRAAKEALSASKWWADFSLQKVMAAVASDYYELLSARELLESKESSTKDVEMILEAAGEMRTAGLRSENDYITARAAVSSSRILLTQARAADATAYARLMTSLGMPVGTQLDVKTKPEGLQNPLFKEGIATLLSQAEEQRADLMARRAGLAGMKEQVVRSSRAALPKLKATGQGGWLEYGRRQGNGYNYSVGMVLDVPLFKGFEYTFQKKQALADVDISAAELKNLQNEIALEVVKYSETVKASSEAMQYSEEFFADALTSYENSLESYKAGLINIFDLLQAQQHLADARNKKVQAGTAWLVSLSQLAFATGSINQ
jgi:outer membrane protein TolC